MYVAAAMQVRSKLNSSIVACMDVAHALTSCSLCGSIPFSGTVGIREESFDIEDCICGKSNGLNVVVAAAAAAVVVDEEEDPVGVFILPLVDEEEPFDFTLFFFFLFGAVLAVAFVVAPVLVEVAVSSA